MYAFTVTTKDRCRHCIVEFDNELRLYFKEKGVPFDVFYKLEESKFTKWHAHGEIGEKWETSKTDKFYVYFKEITDEAKWLGYCNKSELDVGIDMTTILGARSTRPKVPLPEEN